MDFKGVLDPVGARNTSGVFRFSGLITFMFINVYSFEKFVNMLFLFNLLQKIYFA